ncbi:MAG: D-sedoheptulose 7-phosphate isomerase [Bacteroidetes bacterium]|nr:D-sedoheptulose 7-phosphate isomerase [Bacteroidota bacterium]
MDIPDIIAASVAVKQKMLSDPELLKRIEDLAGLAVEVYRGGGKLLFCGNGGSASDAQHLAAELSGRFQFDRAPLFAEALHVNTSYLTAVSNDYGYEQTYARLVRAMGRQGDLLIALSTSGNSPNIVQAVKAAKEGGMHVAGLTGSTGGKMNPWCDLLICVPSDVTARIQEAHILIGHIICELIENQLFGPK